jgi:hypothetical protein
MATETELAKKIKRTSGRPKAKIDWKKVDEMLEAGCFATHIADRLGIDPITLYRACERDKNVGFAAYSQEKKSNGESSIHQAQYNLAVKDKNATMLIWLGKIRCGQTETLSKDAQDIIKSLSDIVEDSKHPKPESKEPPKS